MKKDRETVIILSLIFILAVALRLIQLDKVPPSLNWDEAALGYNAYSILKTGRDEYGVRFPTVLQSFGDYKPSLYTYLAIPSVALFGLNEFAVRFPSALFGFLTVLFTYFLVNELFINGLKRNSELVNSLTRNKSIAFISSFLFAISPWHIQFSRGAFEANLGLFLAVLGTYLFLKALKNDDSSNIRRPELDSRSQTIKIPKLVRNDSSNIGFIKNKYLLPLSAITFSLSMYAYHSSRVFVPLLILSLIFLYRKKLFKLRNWVAVSFLIGAILILPFIKSLTQGEILNRFSGVSAFSDSAILNRSIEKIEEDNNSFIGRIVHNRRIEYAKIFLKNYFSHFNANFLFIEADQNPRHHAPENGLLYFWEIITLPIGFFTLFKLKGKGKWVIFSFLFLAPIAAAAAKASPHAIRFLNSLPAWIIISSFGLHFLLKKFKKAWLLAGLVVLGNLIYWANLYFIHLPLETSQYWQYGYKEVVAEVSKIEKNYNKVIITGQYDQPYIFFLFHKKYEPQKYQTEHKNFERSSEYERAFNKYQFLEKIDLSEIKKDDQILIVATNEEVGNKKDFKVIKKIDFLDGSPAFLVGKKI